MHANTAILLVAFPAITAMAGEKIEKTVIVPEPVAVPSWSMKLDSAWVGSSDYDKGGDGSVFESRIQLAVQRPVDLPKLGGSDGQWVLRIGGDWERFGFSNSDAPGYLPGTLQSVSAVIGLEYRTKYGLGAIFEARPGVFFEHDITADHFDVPIKAAVILPFTERFAMALGFTYGGFRENPILPAAGFYWRITDSLVLNAIPPDPRIEWLVNDTTRVWIGGELSGGSFRTDGDRTGRLNSAVVSYTDYRAAAGVQWRFSEGWSLDAGAGVSFKREFDFHRAGVDVETDDTAPFVKFSLRGEW